MMARKRKHSGLEQVSSPKSKRCRHYETQDSHENFVKRSIFAQYYSDVFTLGEYLCSKLPLNSKGRRKKIRSYHVLRDSLHGADNDNENISVGKFLASTIVGIDREDSDRENDCWTQWESYSKLEGSSDSACRSCDREESSQAEIVDFAIWYLINFKAKTGIRLQHLLCQGYTENVDRQTIYHKKSPLSTIPGLISAYPNRHVTAMKSFPWPQILKLLGRGGPLVMIKLLLDCGIFVAVEIGQGNYCQLSGKPLSDFSTILHRTSGPNLSEPWKSHRAINKIGSQQSDLLRTPSTISFIRNRMFYAKPAYNSSGGIRFGLRHIHVLNRYPYEAKCHEHGINSGLETPPKASLDKWNRMVLQSTIHLAMYIFPRHFGFHNVFTSAVDPRETAQHFKDYTIREDEIARQVGSFGLKSEKMTSFRVPKRLRGQVLHLVQKLRVNHSRCPYQKLLVHYCPKYDSNTSLLDATDAPATFKTQMSNLISNTSLILGGEPCPGSIPRRKIALMDYATPVASVTAFCCAVLARLIPDEVWGHNEVQVHNKFLLFNNVKKFISMRKFETLSLHDVLQGMKLNTISWLASPNHVEGRVSLTDAIKRKQLFHEFLYYVFDSILIPLVRGHFYVTESNAHRHRLFFFRHDTWRSLAEPSLASLKLSMFAEMKAGDAQSILKARRIGYSQLRLLPKETGVRPIMNLRRRTIRKGYKNVLGSSINSVLAPVFNMLTFEKNKNQNRLGSTIASVGDLYSRLKDFKSQLANRSSPLFFVKVDVQAAFDSIPQSAVLQLMSSIPRESEYRIWKHVEIKAGEGHRSAYGDFKAKPIRKWVSRAVSLGDFRSFDQNLVANLAVDKKNTVFVENVVNQLRKKEELIELLAEHIQQNMVKIGKKFYCQKQGIPQGSVLSSLLCNYFYADLEARHLDFLNGNGNLLLRLIDDFLLITTSRDDARRFIQIMHDGIPEYGVTVNPAKTLVNFEVYINKIKIARLVGNRAFPYCGNLVDTKTLNVKKDRKRRSDFSINDALTVEFSRTPGKMLYRRILNAFKIQAHAVFFDTTFNSLTTVLLNIYDNFIDAATKMWQYAKCLPLEKQPSLALILKTIVDLVNLAGIILKGKGRNIKNYGYHCVATHSQVEWLALTAFNDVFRRKQDKYRAVIAWLETRIARLRSKHGKDCVKLTRILHVKRNEDEDL